jgi:DNA-binding NarL/FixJ family response regulator
MVIRVLIADDHQLVRAGIASLLEDIADVDVVGEASDGVQTLKLASELEPDILFLDLTMPGMSGFEALECINQSHGIIKVIVLSMHFSAEHIHRALTLGALGYIPKDALPEELELAINAVSQGNRWLSPAVSESLIDGYLGLDGNDNFLASLSERQHQVLKMIAEGLSTKEMSHTLNLSTKTIETYRVQIMNKLNINNLAGLVRYAIRQGVIPI